MTANKILLAYSGILTLALAISAVTRANADTTPAKAIFDEIDVKRINIRENDGTIRMVMAGTDRAPGIIVKGKERPHSSGPRPAGIMFYNDEGTENGGLVFGGKTGPDGKVSAGGHLSFDQYEQDQVVQITQSEQGENRWAAMIVNDRPDTPLDFGLMDRLANMPEGAERNALIEKLRANGGFGRERLFVGKTRRRDSVIELSDASGRPRIRLKVNPGGDASIDFLDEKGAVIRSVTPAME